MLHFTNTILHPSKIYPVWPSFSDSSSSLATFDSNFVKLTDSIDYEISSAKNCKFLRHQREIINLLVYIYSQVWEKYRVWFPKFFEIFLVWFSLPDTLWTDWRKRAKYKLTTMLLNLIKNHPLLISNAKTKCTTRR